MESMIVMAFITPLEPFKTIAKAAESKSSSADKTQNSGFEDTLINAVQKVKNLEDKSNQASYDLAVGNTDDLTSVMLSATKAQTAIELTTQITSKAVNSYKEIMQMNI